VDCINGDDTACVCGVTANERARDVEILVFFGGAVIASGRALDNHQQRQNDQSSQHTFHDQPSFSFQGLVCGQMKSPAFPARKPIAGAWSQVRLSSLTLGFRLQPEYRSNIQCVTAVRTRAD
jgi:hypothetical protein